VSGGDPRDEGTTRALDAPGPRRPKAPDHRPAWLVLLAALTLLYGGRLLTSAIETWRDPTATMRLPQSRAMTPAEEEVARDIVATSRRVAQAHARTLRADAAAAIPVALVLLFAAAAALARDPRGRGVTLAAAWLGIVYQLASLWLTFPIVRELAHELGGPFSRLATMQGGAADASAQPETMATVLMALPVFAAAVTIGGSLLLIRFFGGTRGRVLYGLERARGDA
jgi:hypothetical protein